MDLRMVWFGTGLGPYRLCDSTYSSFPVDELPALPDHLLDGTFGWLPPGEVRGSMGVDHLPSALRRQVPDVFAAFFNQPELLRAVPSCTGCYWDLTDSAIPGPFGDGDRLVRFLADSQDCFLWYLHILSDGTHQVVAAGERYGDDAPLPSAAHLNFELTIVAGDFESFLYRFWVENTAWYEVVHEQRDEMDLSPAVRDYLAALPEVPLPPYAAPGVEPIEGFLDGDWDGHRVSYTCSQLDALPPVAAALARTPETMWAIAADDAGSDWGVVTRAQLAEELRLGTYDGLTWNLSFDTSIERIVDIHTWRGPGDLLASVLASEPEHESINFYGPARRDVRTSGIRRADEMAARWLDAVVAAHREYARRRKIDLPH